MPLLFMMFWYFLRYPFTAILSETVSLLRPLALLRANILRPALLDMRSRNPCLFFLFLFEG